MTILGKSSIWCNFFQKFEIWSKSWKIRKILKFWNFVEGGAPALRVIRAGTRLTVHRSLPYRTAVNWPGPGPAHIYKNGRRFYVFSDVLYYELLVCYIQSSSNMLKLIFVWILALVLDQTFVNNRNVCSLKIMKNEENFKIPRKIEKTINFRKFSFL